MEEKLTEIARSFTYKLNVGNYETRDFFCSQKLEIPLEKAEKASEELFEFCKAEVMKNVAEWQAEHVEKTIKAPYKKPTKADAEQSQADQELSETLGGDNGDQPWEKE